MVLEFYYDLLSQPCRAVYIFLKASGVPFEAKILELRKGEHLKPEFLKKNPFHKVPVIFDDGFALSESAAIMRYVAAKYNVAEHWYPPVNDQKPENVRVLEYLLWHQMAIRRRGVDIFMDLVQSRIAGFFGQPIRPADDKMLAGARAELSRAVNHIADYFLKDKTFIAGDEISIADIVAVCELMQLHGCNETALYESNPIVKAWIRRVEEQTKPHFEEAHATINEVGQKFSAGK